MKGALLAAVAAAIGSSLLPGAAANVVAPATCVYPLAGTLSGYSGTLTGALTSTNNRLGFNVVCSGALTVPVNTFAALVRIDLPETGSPVTIDTCGSPLDTIITAGVGCPDSTSFAFGCRASNDDATSNFCTAGASRVTFNATTPFVYVLVQGFGGSFGEFTLNYAYLAPSVTPTSTQTPSASATGTATVTRGLPPTRSRTATPRPPEPSESPTTPPSPPETPSNTATPSARPNCFDGGQVYAGVGSGASGWLAGSLDATDPNYYAGTCAGFAVTTAFEQDRLAIDFGDLPLGYQLTLDACTSTLDTFLLAGYGCPNNAQSFGCQFAADDTPGCGPNGWQSRIVIPSLTQRWLYVIMQGFSGTSLGAYNLTWSYALPTPSGTPTRSNTASRTPTGSFTLQPGFSPSGTASPSFTRTSSNTPSNTPTGTRTPSPSLGYTESPSPTRTPSGTATSSGTASGTGSSSNTPSGSQTTSPTASATLSVGETPSNSATSTGSTSLSATSTGSNTGTPSATPSLTATPSNTRTPSATPLCPAPVASVVGLTGQFGTLATAASPAGNALGWAATCTNAIYAANQKMVYRIDLSAFPVGGSLNVNNCAQTTVDTVLFLGTGCPTSAAGFGCVAGADGGCPAGGVTPSSVTIATTTAPVYFAILQLWSSSTAAFSSPFNFTYTLPTPTRTATTTSTPTPSATLSPGVSASETATQTASPTASLTASNTATGSPGCASRLTNLRGTFNTASGTSSTFTMLTTDATTPLSATAVTCPGQGATAVYSRPKHIFALDLTAFPVGGVLMVDTCAGTGTQDTYVLLGTGCPADGALGWGCVAFNDNRAVVTTACPAARASQSNVTIVGTTARLYYVIVSLPASTTILPGTYTLRWSYVAPSPTSTPPPTPTPSPTLSVGAAPSASAAGTPPPSVTPSVTPVAPCPAPVTAMTSLAGTTGTSPVVTAPLTNSLGWAGTCTNAIYAGQPKLTYRIDLSAFPVGGSLNVNNCGLTPADTVLFLGTGCPTSAASFACVGGADGGCPAGGGASSLTIGATTAPVYFVMVQLWTSALNTFTSGLNYTYTLPSQSASPSGTPTPSATATLSSGIAPSSSGTPSNSPTPTPSFGFTPTPSALAGCPVTFSNTATGLSTTSLVVLDPTAPTLVTVSTACTGYAINTLPKQVLAVDLGPTFRPGGSLLATTCGNAGFDTVLYVGAGCPTTAASFGCVAGNDDACASLQSQVAVTGWASRYVYVLATGFSATSLGSMNVFVNYTLPTPSPTSSRTASTTATASLSPGASPSATASASETSSSTATPTPSFEYTLDPSDTPSVTASTSATASVSATLPPGVTPSSTWTPTASLTGTPTPTPTATTTPQCGNLLPIAAVVNGTEGVSRNVSITATSVPLFGGPGVTCSGLGVPLGPKALFAIDLPEDVPLGQPMTVQTCGLGLSTPTFLFAGTGCPLSLDTFGCAAAAGVAGTAAPCGSALAPSQQSFLTIPELPARRVYVIAMQNQGLTGTVGIRWQYQLPSATSSNTPSNSPTPSNTPSATGTPSASATGSLTATPTSSLSVGAEPSVTPSGSPTAASTPSVSRSATASVSTGYSESATPSAAATRTPTPSAACAAVAPVRQTLTGLSGVFNTSAIVAGLPPIVGIAPCAGYALTGNGKQLFEIVLPDAFPLGGSLDVNSCDISGGATLDNVLWVGSGCPTSAAAFGCLAGNDQSGFPGCGDGNQARVVVSPVTKRRYYVLAAGFGASVGNYNLAYSYAPPTPSATITPSETPSPSLSASVGATPSETASVSMSSSGTRTPTPSIGFTTSRTPTATTTPSQTATSSLTASATPSNTASSTVSQGSSPSQTPTATASTSVSASPTPSVTPTPTATPSAPCPPAVEVFGDAGSVSVSIPSTGAPNWALSGCAGITAGTGAFTKRVIRVNLASAPGGSFTANTCGGTTVDTAIWVGTGCGINAANFNCQGGNDDSCGLQSAVTLSALATNTAFVFVSHYAGTAVTGNMTVTWAYTPPSASATVTRTPSVTSSSTASRTVTPSGTPPATQSPSGTPPPSESASSTAASTPSRSASAASTPSRSNTATPSPSNTGSSSNSPSSSATGTAAETATPSTSASHTGTPAETSTPSPAESPSGTAAPSASRSVAASASGSKTRLPTQTRTRTRSATATRTRTRTRTATATRSRTRTKTRTPTKRK